MKALIIRHGGEPESQHATLRPGDTLILQVPPEGTAESPELVALREELAESRRFNASFSDELRGIARALGLTYKPGLVPGAYVLAVEKLLTDSAVAHELRDLCEEYDVSDVAGLREYIDELAARGDVANGKLAAIHAALVGVYIDEDSPQAREFYKVPVNLVDLVKARLGLVKEKA